MEAKQGDWVECGECQFNGYAELQSAIPEDRVCCSRCGSTSITPVTRRQQIGNVVITDNRHIWQRRWKTNS